MSDCWQVLGVAEEASLDEVRQAYAKLIRVHRPDTHPEEFSKIRLAYEQATQWLRHAQVRAPQSREPAALEQEPLAPPPRPARPPAPEPVRVINVHDLARTLAQAPAASAVQLLHEHAALLDQLPIDARIEYDAALLQTLLWQDEPFLPLVRAAAKVFGWAGRETQLSWPYGDFAAQRFAALQEMAQRQADSQTQNANAWQRRLLQPDAAAGPWLGSMVHVTAALETAQQWRDLCERAQLPQLLSWLNAGVLRRMRTHIVLSTDLLLGASLLLLTHLSVARGTQPLSWGWAALWDGFTFLLGAAFPVLRRWSMQWPRIERMWAYAYQPTLGKVLLFLVVAGVLWTVGISIMDSTAFWLTQLVGWILIIVPSTALFGGFYAAVLSVMWTMLRRMELALLRPVLKLSPPVKPANQAKPNAPYSRRMAWVILLLMVSGALLRLCSDPAPAARTAASAPSVTLPSTQ